MNKDRIHPIREYISLATRFQVSVACLKLSSRAT
jgi:hypothetical protein